MDQPQPSATVGHVSRHLTGDWGREWRGGGAYPPLISPLPVAALPSGLTGPWQEAVERNDCEERDDSMDG